jgi:very-short-patch-repair endonuclease
MAKRSKYTKTSEREFPQERAFNALYWEQGLSLGEMARIYRMPYSVLSGYIHSQGWKLRDGHTAKHKTRKHNAALTKEVLTDLYSVKKMSTFEIAEQFGFSRDSIVRGLHKHSIAIRRSAYVTWSHKLLVRELKASGLEVLDSDINYMVRPTRYMVDVAFPAEKLAVEVDGRSHFEDKDGYFGDRISYDTIRDQKLNSLGWTVIRYTDTDIRRSLYTIVADINSRLGRNSHEYRAPETIQVVR